MRHFENHGVDGRIILKWIIKNVVNSGYDMSDSGNGQVAGGCEHGIALSGFFLKSGEFPHQLTDN
jgi:hypothetical protein